MPWFNNKKCLLNMYSEGMHGKTDKNGKNKREKGQAMACKTLHRKLKIEQHEPQ